MKSIDDVGISFVNAVVTSGSYNGVVTMTLGAYLFSPGQDEDGKPNVDPDLAVTARLRMDAVAARQVYESLGKIIGAEEAAKAAAPSQPNGGARGVGSAPYSPYEEEDKPKPN